MVSIAKKVFKCVVILLAAVVCQIFISMFFLGYVAPTTTHFGKTGTMLVIFMLSILAPAFSVSLAVGLIGGIWLKERTPIGFVLSLIYAVLPICPLWNKMPLKLNFGTLLFFLGIPLTAFVGSLIYYRVVSLSDTKSISEEK